ncbi:DMT family transporter [Pseudodonghicola sp.]|uniref:DMT family transporter n=1 Tax=Pseudodonghicola sp. TaxID=1969463 RepID=UPI003A98288F
MTHLATLPGDNRPLTAAAVMICAMTIAGVADNVIPLISAEIGLWQFHLTRALLALPLLAALSALGLGRFWPRRYAPVALRSLLLAVSMMFYYAALSLMPIGEALAGLFTSPIFILLITALGLRQRIGPWRILAVALGFAGILFVLRPDPAHFDGSILLAVAGGLFYALGSIATRSLCEGESTVALLAGMLVAMALIGAAGVAVLAVFPVEAAPGAAGFALRGWVWPMASVLPWVAVQALGVVGGVFLIIKAYQLGEASYVAVFEYSVIIVAPFTAWILYGQAIEPAQAIGIALIVSGGGIIAIRSK